MAYLLFKHVVKPVQITQSSVNILGRVSRVYYDLCRENSKSKVCHLFCTNVVVPQVVGAEKFGKYKLVDMHRSYLLSLDALL